MSELDKKIMEQLPPDEEVMQELNEDFDPGRKWRWLYPVSEWTVGQIKHVNKISKTLKHANNNY